MLVVKRVCEELEEGRSSLQLRHRSIFQSSFYVEREIRDKQSKSKTSSLLTLKLNLTIQQPNFNLILNFKFGLKSALYINCNALQLLFSPKRYQTNLLLRICFMLNAVIASQTVKRRRRKMQQMLLCIEHSMNEHRMR